MTVWLPAGVTARSLMQAASSNSRCPTHVLQMAAHRIALLATALSPFPLRASLPKMVGE